MYARETLFSLRYIPSPSFKKKIKQKSLLMLSSLPVGRAVEVADCPFCVFPAEVKRGGALPLSHLSGGKQAFSCVPVKAVFPHSFIDGPATSGAPHTSSYKAIVLFSVLRKTVSCLSSKVPVFPGSLCVLP